MSEVIGIISSGVAIVGAVAGWVTTSIKSKKKEKLVKIAKILQKLPEYIKAAEESCSNPGSGLIKKLLVLNQCNIECNNQGIEYREEEWSAEIEKILDTPQKKEI